MERVANPSVEFSVSRKKSPSNFDDVVWFKKMMGFHRQENDPGRPFDGVRGEGVGGGGGGGPDNCNGGGATEAVGPTYGDGVSSSRFGGEIFATSSTTNSRPPSDIFAAAYSTSPYKSPEEMAANAAFPFTFAQWKELERQAMIYKYMISSVPVPPDLLFPHSRNCFVAALDSPASLYNVRYSSNGDPEPGRCKRTDGKKWRCSRDVAPHQKYCERHLHRGRPRSRKPVEVRNNGENFKKTRIQQSHATNSAAGNDKSLLLFNAKTDVGVSDAPSYAEPIRGLSLMKEDTDQRLQLSIERNMGYDNVGSSVYDTSSSFHQNYVEQQPLNALPYSNFLTPEIDAPIGIHNPESSLNLSIAMSCGNVADQEMGSIEWRDDQSVKDPRWNNPALWEAFARGGPLAEALQLGSAPVSGYNNVASPRSAPATTVSSPTGVLHRTLFSHSDSSVCNSPTPAAPTSEMGVQQLD